ncbi:MAG: hypothetical protein LGB78_04385 [Sulfurovum sp.]|nr:hypothetical protein [Sulfurovum sp.]MCB4763127.1 hypothetical protein [Sulfurovum sp.]MCB4773337.1 hypothetical protein [Sulfurovum sp.]MCB4780980.1 hypothetical protein [Sulfurovum sp.]MCB4782625.1 hypothetical protein [Sulfurovum sp.]
MEQITIGITCATSTVSIIGVIMFLSKKWFIKKLQHEYDKKLSAIQHDREVSLKAELIADLLSEWISKDVDYQRLNDLSFKAFLWLPAEIANDLSASLSHREDAPDVRVLIDKVRKHLLGSADKFESSSIIVFNDPNK